MPKKKTEEIGGSPEAEAQQSDKKLGRELTLVDLLFLCIGAIVGSGWLLAAPFGAALAGPDIIYSSIIGGVIILFIALNYAEISGAIPKTGAVVRYPHLSHGGYVGYLLGWTYLLSAVTVPTIEAEAGFTYASYYISGLTKTAIVNGNTVHVLTPLATGLAFLMIVGFFFLNYFGIRLLGKVNTYIGWWKLIIPTLTFIFLFAAFRASNFSSNFGGVTSIYTPESMFMAIPLAGIAFSYLGFRQALEFGGEAKNPQRDIPRATILAVLIGIALYTLLQIAFMGAIRLGPAGITLSYLSGSNPSHTSYLTNIWAGIYGSNYGTSPFFYALKYTGVPLLGAFATLILIDAWVSPAGTGWIYMGTGTRTFYGLSADGYYPKKLLEVNEKTRIPVFALIAALIVGVVFLLPFPSWYLLVGFISLATILTYVIGGVALQVFRREAPDMKRPFRLPYAKILSPVAFIAAVLVVYWGSFLYLYFIFTTVFVGLPFFFFIYAPQRLGLEKNRSYAFGIAQLVGVVLLSIYAYLYIVFPSSAPSVDTLSGSFLLYFILLALVIFSISYITERHLEGDKKKVMSSSYWLIAMLFVVYFISFFGSLGFVTSAYYAITFPWDNVLVIFAALFFYEKAVNAGYKTEDMVDLLAIEGMTVTDQQ